MWLECGESTVVWVWIVGYVVLGLGDEVWGYVDVVMGKLLCFRGLCQGNGKVNMCFLIFSQL